MPAVFCFAAPSWHHAAMKLLLALTALIIAISLACTGSKSAGSPSNQVTNASPAEPAQPSEAPKQEIPTCGLTLAGAPTINGIRLGMTADELLALFPGSKDDVELKKELAAVGPFGNSTFDVRPAKYESKEKFADIKQIVVNLLDGRVSKLNFGYNGPEYPHVDKFVTKVVEGKGLPQADQWQAYTGMDNQLKILTCKEFEMRVFAGGPGGSLNYVLLHDLTADKTLRDRRAKARANATPTPNQ